MLSNDITKNPDFKPYQIYYSSRFCILSACCRSNLAEQKQYRRKRGTKRAKEMSGAWKSPWW
jgi:hypothetical protein